MLRHLRTPQVLHIWLVLLMDQIALMVLCKENKMIEVPARYALSR
ncbi:MAG: hypothetical protein JWM36_3401 [Hyphomicrobiales bacterium]|nr:hypothetical protein [Hyphomicrobiales bacterium]